MRIVSWNMGCAPPMAKCYRSKHSDAWRYLLNDLKPDVALVQEALFADSPPDTFGQTFWCGDRGHDSGTGIVIRKGIVASRLDIKSEGSYIAGAEVNILGVHTLVASIHVGPKNYRKHLKALAEAMTNVTAGRRFVFGGDLNAARNIDVIYKTQWYGNYFADLAYREFYDCHWAQHGMEKQSFWGRQAHNPYQCDHLFADATTARLVADCELIDNDTVRTLSDHGPMILDLATDLHSG